MSQLLDFHSSSTPSPDMLSKRAEEEKYRTCYYHNKKYCCSKICTLVVLLLFTTVAPFAITCLALYLDNWAGISTNPEATLNLAYPRLGPKYLDYVMFNKTIPNDDGTLYQYIDEAKTERFTMSRFGLLSHCKSTTKGPKISLFKTPWKAPVCKASWDEFQCPIVAMRTMRGVDPRAPRSMRPMHGCIKKTQVCDGTIDCPSGHDELNCPSQVECPADMVQCSPQKKICIPKSAVCDGINNCGMYEDEQNCCGRVGFLRCGDGSCVMGQRCDAKADCFDLSDEYDCPDPSSQFYAKCNDGQLIESVYKCEKKTYPSFQCNDLSDETACRFDPQPLPNNPALKSLEYDEGSACFKQAFTFKSLNSTFLELNYPDAKQREFAESYEFSTKKIALVAGIGVAGFLCVLALLMLSCIGCITRRCRSMRLTFLVLCLIYLLCLLQALMTGIFWVHYVDALNEVMENPRESDIYEQVAIETIRVTGGLASIRISTHLTFYNCGFFGLAFILAILAAQLVKNASCHKNDQMQSSYDYPQGKYKYGNYSADYPDHQTVTHSLLGNDSRDHTDNGIPTPDQVVTPQMSTKSLERSYFHSASDGALRSSHNHKIAANGNTYKSYNDKFDSLDSHERPSMQHYNSTLPSAKQTPV